MAILTQSEIDALRNKGLTDDRIAALAQKHGDELPKDGFWKSLGKAVIKSETGFGQSIAAGLGGNAPQGSLMRNLTGQSAIDQANSSNQQITQNIISKIQEKRARGEDVSRLTNALKFIDSELNFYDILNTSTGGSLDKNAKQVFGEGLGVATDILGAGALPGGVGQATRATSFIQGLKTGAKAGAVGGSIFGAAKGATTAAQDNKTGGQIVGAGVRGGIEGGVAGGVIGGAIGGVSGAINGRADRLLNKQNEFAKDLASPKQTPRMKEEAIKQGRVTDPGILKKSTIDYSSRDEEVANAISDVVNRKASLGENIDAIRYKVSTINNGVGNYIEQNKVPFNSAQLRSSLQAGKEDLKLVFASENNAEKTYDAVAKVFMDNVKGKDTYGLFQGRQTFDKIPAVRKLLESQTLGENARKQIVLAIRKSANEYIARLLPAGNEYATKLRSESLMLEALGNIAEKNIGRIGKNSLQLLTERYPILKWWVAGLAGAAGIGVGGAIIGSTD